MTILIIDIIILIAIIIVIIMIVAMVQPECIEDHGEKDELAKEGDNKGGGGDDLGEEEEEHGQGEQD